MADPNPYTVPVSANSATIGGSLPFQGPPAADNYMQQYDVALKQNQASYGNILQGYQSAQQSQQAMQQGIQQGYSTLSSNVLGTIQGIDASQRQAIRDTYARQAGSAAQGLISRGLGNTTVANSVQRGLLSDRGKADIALSNQTAQLTAGYQSNLGLAGLNYANQANTQNTALKSQQLGYMASLKEPYPNNLGYAQFGLQRSQLGGGVGGGSLGTTGGGRGGGQGGGRGGRMPGENPNPYDPGRPFDPGGRPSPMDYQRRPLPRPSPVGPQGFNPQARARAGIFSRAGYAGPSQAQAYDQGDWANQGSNFDYSTGEDAGYGDWANQGSNFDYSTGEDAGYGDWANQGSNFDYSTGEDAGYGDWANQGSNFDYSTGEEAYNPDYEQNYGYGDSGYYE